MKIISAELNFETRQLSVTLEYEQDVQAAFDLIRSDQPSQNPAPSVAVDDIRPAIRALWNSGQKIQAIKLYRVVTLRSLVESKKACEVIGGETLPYYQT